MANPRLRILVAALSTVAVTLGAMAAIAQAPHWRRPPPPPVERTAAFSVSLEDEQGSPLETYRHRGTTWVLGEEGERYVIVVRNPTGNRVEAVISVDGRDAISGRVADFRNNRGYVLPPFGSVRVEGFRQSLDHVATFRFTDPGNSYSSRMGTPQNVGIIGVAFFPERVQPVAIPVPEDRERRKIYRPRPSAPSKKPSAGAAPSTRAEQSDSNIGTEYGETRGSRVTQTHFERQSNTPVRVITLRYDDASGLEARGIQLFSRPSPRPIPRPLSPEAFPDSRFAPPPPTW